jgi:hypothetical protein
MLVVISKHLILDKKIDFEKIILAIHFYFIILCLLAFKLKKNP